MLGHNANGKTTNAERPRACHVKLQRSQAHALFTCLWFSYLNRTVAIKKPCLQNSSEAVTDEVSIQRKGPTDKRSCSNVFHSYFVKLEYIHQVSCFLLQLLFRLLFIR
ncbi:hypothetical protein XELAEV_18021268mg [Xenopus laevis]|uniref:Uncharacterized protein n=1 Tax=Xenopus laevis TaxID=8355 RepID=A0A974HRU2_XENLA|nr:hypothetical protein XELAEV_18021268mg [Xenopus laevis]